MSVPCHVSANGMHKKNESDTRWRVQLGYFAAASLIARNSANSARLSGVAMPWRSPAATMAPVSASCSSGRLARRSKYIEVPSSPEKVNSVASVRAASSAASLRPFGAADRDRLFEHREAERLDVGAPQHRLPLQRQRGDRTGDGVEQELAPRQRGEVLTELDAQRRAFEQLSEGAAGIVVGDNHIRIGATPQLDVIGAKPFAVVIDNHRQHGRGADERCDTGDVVDAILQHCHAGRRRAKRFQPWRGRGRGVGLGAQQHPVDWIGLRRIGERVERKCYRAIRGIEG